MKFKFECPYCGQRISATEADINTVGGCPACDRDVVVPAPAATLELPSVPSAPASDSVPGDPAASPPAAAGGPHLPVVPPRSAPAPVAAVRRAPQRPARPTVAPVPVPRRIPPAFAEMDFREPERTQPRVPIFTFLFCVVPVPAVIALRHAGLLAVERLDFALGLAGFVCLLSIIFAHNRWGRSKGGAFARTVAVLGFVGGYLSILAIAFVFASIATGVVVQVKPVAEIPDFVAEPVHASSSAPTVASAVVASTGSSPAPAPASATAATGEFSAEQVQFFEGKIRPILVDKCYKCHAIETGKSKGKLTLDTREGLLKGGETGPGLKPGDPDGSLLIKAVLYTDSDLQMPPKNEKLSDGEIADLVAWVKMGAPDPRKAPAEK